MANLLNLHRLFNTRDGYLGQLKVADVDSATLSRAREIIRKTLKDAFRNWERFIAKADLFEAHVLQKGAEIKFAGPKFRIQGSFAYYTVNDCQHPPHQQIDQDDGMFLPVSFIAINGNAKPRITARGYFKLVEAALKPICQRENWILNPAPIKGSCVRVGLSERLHLDIPLFAVSDETFENLRESVIKAFMTRDAAMDSASTREDDELSEDLYKALQDNDIVLAHRDDGWVGSDPRKLEDWFNAAIDTYGEIIRRFSRVYKGWRDAHWTECDLSSICIMAAVVKAVSNLHPFEDNRDDLCLLAICKEMVKIFASPIENPAFPGDEEKSLCKGWKPEFRIEVQSTLSATCANLKKALYDTMHKGLALRSARAAFGDRVPENEALISLAGVAAFVRKVEPIQQPKPMVPRTTSG
jgi:hypothetical protein